MTVDAGVEIALQRISVGGKQQYGLIATASRAPLLQQESEDYREQGHCKAAITISLNPLLFGLEPLNKYHAPRSTY